MTIPALDARGLLPKGIHDASLRDVQVAFCFNAYREQLWHDVLRGLIQENIPQSNAFPLFIAGSFLSDKPTPSDIEMAIQLNADNFNLPGASRLFQVDEAEHHRLKIGYRLDFYPYIGGMGNDFSLFFQYVGEKTAESKKIEPKDKRGIIRIRYDNMG